MFALLLKSPNSRSGWFYSGSFLITFSNTATTLEKKIREIFFEDRKGFTLKKSELVCEHKTIFGARYDELGEGITMSNEETPELKIFISCRAIEKIETDTGGKLWVNGAL